MAQSKRKVVTNLAVLKASRRPPMVGDIFAMEPPDGKFLFGRVISVDANPLGIGGAILIYIYRARSPDKLRVPELFRERLLVPPIMTNRLPWSKGYFEFVKNRALGPTDVLPQHCFKNSEGSYYDEHGKHLMMAIEPVGEFGLHSYRTIDDAVSKALGIPAVSED